MNKEEKTKLVLEEIEKNRNHSWFEEIKNRAKNNLSKPAFKYRGLTITYGEFIGKVEKEWAPALKANGIGKNTRMVVCLSSTPELCYLMGAASVVGARINFVSSSFDSDYLYSIVAKSGSDYFFVGEDQLSKMMPTLEKMGSESNKKVVPISLNNSLPNGNPFADVTNKFEEYDKEEYINNVNKLTNKVELKEFLNRGLSYTGKVAENSTLDDIFTTSYSSGTTDGNKPKGINHRNRHYIVMGRYHDSEISHIPNMKNSVTYSNIPTQSNSYIASIISDTLMEGACIALDPIINKAYFLFGAILNGAYMAIATTSTWLYVAKLYYGLSKEEQVKIKAKSTLFPVAVGEPLAPGEEKFLNKFARDIGCGIAITHLPFSISKFSVCGGDCEHGSIFIRELRAVADLKKDRRIEEPIGLRTYDFVEVKALRKDGTYCEPNEYGRLVANSACTMVGYDDEPERTDKFFITDAYGKLWADLGCHGYVDKDNNTYMKGRMSEDKSIIPEFFINDEIQKDTKCILSSSVVCVDDSEYGKYVAYVDLQPDCKISTTNALKRLIGRCKKKFGDTLVDNLYISLVDSKEGFKLTGCEKRDNIYLRNRGITIDCMKATDIIGLTTDEIKVK